MGFGRVEKADAEAFREATLKRPSESAWQKSPRLKPGAKRSALKRADEKMTAKRSALKRADGKEAAKRNAPKRAEEKMTAESERLKRAEDEVRVEVVPEPSICPVIAGG